jgi:hypothetical protein
MWHLTANRLPDNNTLVQVKIDDERGCRNEGRLLYESNMWWTPDGSMYVYYVPTHWKPIR